MQERTEAIGLAHAVLEEMTIVVNAIAEIEKVLPANENVTIPIPSPSLCVDICLRLAAEISFRSNSA